MKQALLILLSVLLFACKKDNTSSTQTNATNYLILNGDRKELGTMPTSQITVGNASWNNPDEWQLSVSIKNACYQIGGLNNGDFEVFIDIWDKNLLQSDYNIVPGLSGGGSTAGPTGTASMGMRPHVIGGGGLAWLDARSGSIHITKDNSGKLKSAEFINIPLSDSRNTQTTHTASGNFTLSL